METLTIQFADIKEATGLMQIQWENTSVNIHLKTNNLDDRIMANIKEAMKGEQKPYFAAIWYYNHNKDLNQALSWMQEADKAQPNSFAMKYWIARIQLKRGDKAAAIASGKEGLRIATEQKNAEYIRLNSDVLRDAGVN